MNAEMREGSKVMKCGSKLKRNVDLGMVSMRPCATREPNSILTLAAGIGNAVTSAHGAAKSTYSGCALRRRLLGIAGNNGLKPTMCFGQAYVGRHVPGTSPDHDRIHTCKSKHRERLSATWRTVRGFIDSRIRNQRDRSRPDDRLNRRKASGRNRRTKQ